MKDRVHQRLTDAELHAFFDDLFPDGFAGADVLAEIAPEGWEQSPLLACLHPSVEQRYHEAVQLHRNTEAFRTARARSDAKLHVDEAPSSEPTLEDIGREYQPTPVSADEEVAELVGLCLWDVFSDDHDVIARDGRVADIGSFRGAGAFLDEHVTGDQTGRLSGDYMRFYMGTIWISRRADLTPVYAMIFRRLRARDADWIYHFPELGLVDLGSLHVDHEQPLTAYSVTDAAGAELKAQHRRVEVERLRSELADMNTRARDEALDHPPPATVRAYRQVYGRDPRGWPPA